MRNALLCLLLLGCGTDGAADDPNVVDLVSQRYTLQPGEEKYFCYTMRLPADRDIAIKKITPTYGVGTHHILFAQTIATEPEGFSECNVLFKQTWVPLYTGGLDSGPVSMPEGVGFSTLERGQQVIMQLHLQNATDEVISDLTSLEIDIIDKTPEMIEAGIFGMDNRQIDIPPNTDSKTIDMNCTSDQGLEVFAVLGHMHKRGVRLEVSRGATAGVDKLYEGSWNFEEQPIEPIAMQIQAGENLHLSCTHANNTNVQVDYGESSDNEMCAFVFFYAPASSQLDGCIKQ
ncbi:MAG: hypothetical protein ACKV2T_21195 [Kofleriaceae bacterium]